MTMQANPTQGQGATSPADLLIEISAVTKVFETDELETHALSNVHLAVRKGEWLSIVGPSGSGKTTLLAIMGLLEAPTSGRYLLAGRDTSTLAPKERAAIRNQHVGFVFQSFNLIGDLTIAENVELPLFYRGIAPRTRRTRVARALEQVDMSHRANHLPSQLSGGQQQRVAVARAIVGEPLVLLADEPTGNLDSTNGNAVLALLAQLNASGSTICMVTHDVALARSTNRMVRLFDGQVVEDAPVTTQLPGDQHARSAS